MLTEAQKQFLVEAAQAAIVAERVTGCPAELSVAQCILESAWGARAPMNNYFGIKHTSGPDNYQLTREYLDGSWRSMRLDFQSYPTAADAFIAHGRLLTDGAPYKDAWEAYQEDPQHDLDTLIGAIARRYATDPGYPTQVMALAHGPNTTAAIAAARVSHPAVLV